MTKKDDMATRGLPDSICTRSVIFTRAGNSDELNDGRTLEGYAAVFDMPTAIRSWEGSFDEEIARGAFKKSLRERTPKLQFDHGRDPRTGSVPIGAIAEVKEDEHGLYVRARLFDNPVVEPIRQAIEAEAVDGMSFRFEVEAEEWRDKDGKKLKEDELYELLWRPGDRGPLKRTIKRAKVFELGPVVFPAYDSTSVGVRSLLSQITEEEREALIQEIVRRINAAGVTPEETVEKETERSEATEAPETEVHSEEERTETEDVSEETSEDAGQSDTRSAGGGTTDDKSRSDEASTQEEEVSAAILKAELEDERRKQERRIRDAKLRKLGILK